MKLEAGMQAPDFTLFNSEKKQVTLSDYKGKTVLLLFFPLAFTNTCTVELCSIRDNIQFYEGVNAVVFGISVDSVHSLAQYKKQQNLNFSLLSDFNKEVSTLYGSLYEKFGYGMKGVSKRSAFLIDKEGVFRYVEILENANEIPDFERIQETIAALH